jgi:23S rRNA (uridine2479-2'-O)-methyltransferase
VPTRTRIRSANADFQLLLALRDNRRQRARQRRFLVEGVRPIDQALAHGWTVDAFVHAVDRTLSRWARDLLASGRARSHVELAAPLLAELSEKEDPSELLAVLELPPDDLERIPEDAGLVVVLDRPTSPGNLGSIVRTADAFGADSVVVTGHAADPYDPQAIRASTGSVFALPVVRAGGPEDLDARLPGIRVVGSSAAGETPVADADLSRPLVLALGNETRGLSRAWRERCDQLVRIPTGGSADSLNVAAAAAILLYEAARA